MAIIGIFPCHSSSSLLLLFQLLVIVVLICSLVCHAGWTDPDTPDSAKTVVPLPLKAAVLPAAHHHHAHNDDEQNQKERIYSLVFSDEFNTPHRTFRDGEDPRWTALDKNDYTNNAQHYYSSDNAYTDTHGHLIIKSEAQDTIVVGFSDVKYKKEKVTKHFKSAMLQSWNKFCFSGGIVEAELALPGRHDVGGLWPAFWLLGNLARHTYVGSSQHVWPWSSSACTDGSRGGAQRVSACDPVQHYGMRTGSGRGAPEIDILEVQAGNDPARTGAFLHMPVGQPFLSTSYQVSPGILPRPVDGKHPAPGAWYDNLTAGVNTTINSAFYGTFNHFLDDTDPKIQDYWSDAISFNRQLNKSHFSGTFHKVRLEWELPDAEGFGVNNYTEPTHGYLRWFLDDQFVLEVDGSGLHASGTGGEISSEPMYILLNTAISTQWGFPQCPSNCPCKIYNCDGEFEETCGFSKGFCDMIQNEPTEFKINWVRVYQDKNDPKQKVGCSTRERPTKKFIVAHEKKYKRDVDVQPLKKIQHGGGKCSPTTPPVGAAHPEPCGGESRGVCSSKSNPRRCECLDGWTGPHCLNPLGYDDIIWEPPETWSDLGFHGPDLRGGFGATLALLSMMEILFVVRVMLKKRRRDWKMD